MLPEPSKPIVVVVLSDALRITMQSVTLPFSLTRGICRLCSASIRLV